MNPAIKRFVEYSLQLGETPYLVFDGLEGMIDGAIRMAKLSDATRIISRGGTIIRSTRSRRFYEPKHRSEAAEQLMKRGIDKLVLLGGNGSYQGMERFQSETGIAVGCIPATIDNDVPGTDYCIGTDTALNVIREAIDDIRDTASSFSRAFVIETMGRNCGYLAMISALVSGAEVCLVPELPHSFKTIKERLATEIKKGRTYVLAIVSEGVDQGSTLLRKMFENDLGISSRVTVLGHIQRGGSPTVYDRLMAFEFVTVAIDELLAGKTSFAVCSTGGDLTAQPLIALPEKPAMDPKLLKLVERLSS